MSKCWLNVVGVTALGTHSLAPEQQALLDQAKIIVGPPRSLPKVRDTDDRFVVWESPLDNMVKQILSYRGTPTVILATGDPTWYGIGATLTAHLDEHEFAIHPAPSAFSLAAARMKWPLQNVKCVSVHGRPVEILHSHIVPGQRILALTSDATTVQAIANILNLRGYGESQLTVLNAMGGETESRIEFLAKNQSTKGIGNLNTVAIDCVADDRAPILPPLPGLPDGAFVHDGQLTKREVRAATLAKLCPLPGQHLWDVGAGSGSVAIEWMRGAPRATATCFERHVARIEMIEKNRVALGAPGLKIISGQAPESFQDVTPPDAIFIGGDVGNESLFEACWAALKPGGRLVANAVTLDGEVALVARLEKFGGDFARIEVSHLDAIGAHKTLRPRMAVTQWNVTKTVGDE
ncbi:precorrin-6y C5,15-methyltransferase (decarboxylating) subunit CbiE [Maritalea sp.]|uniref:precorrin-6y C5,15-methyltransferase (decarboxylating) subunit CbiE n=1 Tax=Maritalea sp. TaxID=2003361 RepID=UPI003EF75881